ncbi:MAG: HAD family phosphatase [Actinomycetota bacterium]|nr:HAD family phosphatase [Actinomycetota bacterium]
MAAPDAVLWDLDGTLIDSEPYWIAGEQALAGHYGVDWTHEDALGVVGMALLDAAAVLHGAGIPLEPPKIVELMVDHVVEKLGEEVPWRPGARELLGALGAAGIPCALVTMSYRSIADRVASSLPAGTFATIVAGDEVQRGKPDPEPYLVAAGRLGVDIERCLIVEDSRTGLASAEASGARVLAVPAHVEIPPAPGRSRLPTLEGVTIADLGRIAAGETVDQLAVAAT